MKSYVSMSRRRGGLGLMMSEKTASELNKRETVAANKIAQAVSRSAGAWRARRKSKAAKKIQAAIRKSLSRKKSREQLLAALMELSYKKTRSRK